MKETKTGKTKAGITLEQTDPFRYLLHIPLDHPTDPLEVTAVTLSEAGLHL